MVTFAFTAAAIYEVPVEPGGLAVAGIGPAPPDDPHDELRNPGKKSQKREGKQNRRGNYARKTFEFAEPRAGVHVDRRAGEHPDLADEVEGEGADRREPHEQVHGEERHDGDQPQGEEKEGTVACDSVVDRPEPVAEPVMHPVAKQVPRRQERQRRAEARGE